MVKKINPNDPPEPPPRPPPPPPPRPPRPPAPTPPPPPAPPPPPPPAPPAPPPEMGVSLCNSDLPLALLPVRLETRFFTLADGSRELRIRIYPDKIHLDTHETALLPAELQWARHYWDLVWRSGGQLQSERDAWRQLADRYGAPRAAWLVRVQRPSNLAQRPDAPQTPDAVLSPAPLFPDAEVVDDGQDAAWRRAPLVRLMPDRWIAVATNGGTVIAAATGRDVARPLHAGPAPQAAEQQVPDDQPAVDADMRWMIDFDSAETAGMALRMRLPEAAASTGIERLVVLGVASSLAPADAALQFDHLLDAHRHTDGLEFLRLGTPTNNTAERRSGYGADPGHERQRAALVGADAAAADDESNAVSLARVLGIAPERVAAGLAGTLGAADAHARDQRCINTALWSPTWGYYLANMVGFDGTGLQLEHIAWARERFVAQVRAGGPFAALRCGQQPYGLLPVTSVDAWQASAAASSSAVGTALPPLSPETLLRNLLRVLRDQLWGPRVSEVPHVGRTDDPDSDLAQVMRSDAASSHYAVRPLLGRHYTEHLRSFVGEDLAGSGFNATRQALAAEQLQRLGIPWHPRLADAVYGDLPWRITGALVQAGEVSPWAPLAPDYIGALLDAPGIAEVLAIDASNGPAASLLHALLRHGLLLEVAGAAARLLGQARGIDPTLLVKDFELVDLVEGSGLTATWARQLDETIDGVTNGLSLREHLGSLSDFSAKDTVALGEFRAALAHLRTLDSETLLHLMQGTLDLASHRLDAWIGSYANERLATLRSAQPLGLRVGGYGWVENLRPAALASAPVTPPAGEAGPLVAPPGDTGFIHAPSMSHAATAALLRNAHLGHDGAARPDGPFAIDLSSRRLRDARWLLDGVRQGQPLGALLGYRFERRLHELRMDRYIAPLRTLAPLSAGRLVGGGEPLEAIAANNVVDGLLLWQRWHDERENLRLDGLPLPQRLGSDFAAVRAELDGLGEAIDATSDALTAESAYQMVRGNLSRNASTLAAVTSGDAPVPELEVARTPRSGIAATHRVLLALNAVPGPATGWAAVARSPRAAADPVLNAWAATLLGDPRHVSCSVEQLDDAGAQVVARFVVRLSDLQFTPMDLVYSVDPDQRSGQVGELQQWLLHRVRSTHALGPAVRLRIVGRRASSAPGAAAHTLALDDVIGQAVLLRRLLSAVRPLEAGDVALPEHAGDASTDLAELGLRCTRAEAALAAAHKALSAVLQLGGAATGDALRVAITRLRGFSIAGTVPLLALGDDEATRSTLRSQASALSRETRARLAQGAALRAQADAGTDENRRDRIQQRLRAVFGAGFVALPCFRCGNAPALSAALAASRVVQGGDPLAVHTWFDRVERVRDAVSRCGALLRGAEVLATGDGLRLTVAQLPLAGAGERWVALPLAPGQAPQHGRLSLVVHSPTGVALDPAAPMCGLLVDEWVDVLPSRSETTALAFQFNPPDACAPQAVLLAVPPVPGQPWSVAGLHRTLTDTLDLARLRGVDAEALSALGHYLPALHLAVNDADDAVSTDFGPLSRGFQG